jgi:hypothetical protein
MARAAPQPFQTQPLYRLIAHNMHKILRPTTKLRKQYTVNFLVANSTSEKLHSDVSLSNILNLIYQIYHLNADHRFIHIFHSDYRFSDFFFVLQL